MSPEPTSKLLSPSQSIQSLTAELSPQLSPVFKSEAAKQIIKEMTEKKPEVGRPRKRQVPREKRRHYTVSSSKPIFDLEDSFTKMVETRLLTNFTIAWALLRSCIFISSCAAETCLDDDGISRCRDLVILQTAVITFQSLLMQ
jgi:hypothetical protein